MRSSSALLERAMTGKVFLRRNGMQAVLSAAVRAAKGRPGYRRDPYIVLPRLCYDGVLSMRTREAMMGAKYSAEWWEKIAALKREISAREDPSSVTDDLIQATAGAKSPASKSPARKSEAPPLQPAPGGDLRKIKTDRFLYR